MPYEFPAPLLQKVFGLAYFVALAYGAGYTLTRGREFTKDALELHVMRGGIGLACLPLLFIVLGTLRMPLHWTVPLAACVAYPVINHRKLLKEKRKKIKVSWHDAAAVLVASGAFAVALSGSLNVPYLEDGDPWEHAMGVKYVAHKLTYMQGEVGDFAHYLFPYPPSYDVLMGLVHQLVVHLQWTLKAVNSLLVGLTFLYAFYFVKALTGKRDIAIYSVALLSFVPSFGSHAIWAQTLAVAVLFPIFYLVVESSRQSGLKPVAVLALASGMLVQPQMSMVIGLLYILYMMAYANDAKRLRNYFTIGLSALILSMVYWVPVVLHPVSSEVGDIARGIMGGRLSFESAQESREASVAQLVFPDMDGDIFVQSGWGLLFTLLAFGGAFHALASANRSRSFLRKRRWLIAVIAWFGFLLAPLIVDVPLLSVYSDRYMGLFPVAGSVLAGYMCVAILDHISSLKRDRRAAAVAILVLAFLTSGAFKLAVQLTEWPSDLGLFLEGDIRGYVVLKSMPPDTMVYPLCLDDKFVVGMDKLSPAWEPGIADFREGILEKDTDEIYGFLKRNGYRFAIADVYCVEKCVGSGTDLDECIERFDSFADGLKAHPALKLSYNDEKSGLFTVL